MNIVYRKMYTNLYINYTNISWGLHIQKRVKTLPIMMQQSDPRPEHFKLIFNIIEKIPE